MTLIDWELAHVALQFGAAALFVSLLWYMAGEIRGGRKK